MGKRLFRRICQESRRRNEKKRGMGKEKKNFQEIGEKEV